MRLLDVAIRRACTGAVITLAVGLAGCWESRTNVHTQTCFIRDAGNRLVVLEYEVANIETCAARLEVRHIQSKAPVAGVYAGHDIYISAEAIEAAAPNYPRSVLITPADRQKIDAAIHALLERQGQSAP